MCWEERARAGEGHGQGVFPLGNLLSVCHSWCLRAAVLAPPLGIPWKVSLALWEHREKQLGDHNPFFGTSLISQILFVPAFRLYWKERRSPDIIDHCTRPNPCLLSPSVQFPQALAFFSPSPWGICSLSFRAMKTKCLASFHKVSVHGERLRERVP